MYEFLKLLMDGINMINVIIRIQHSHPVIENYVHCCIYVAANFMLCKH